MQNSKKTFIAGLNSDDSYFAHKPDDNVDALNVRVMSSSEGKSGSLSNIIGNRQVTNSGLLFGGGDNKVIGSLEDPTTNNVFYFVCKTGGYSYIFMLRASDETIYTVLQDSNLNSNYTLNFKSTKPITAIAHIDGLLYWSGVEDREPCKINVERGIKTNHPGFSNVTEYALPIDKNIITVIRKPPMIPLTVVVQEDSTRDTSFLKSRTLTFAYRYIYNDGEISVFSPTTPHYPNQDVDDTNHKTSKKILVGFPLNEATNSGIADDINKIQFAVRFDKDTSYFVWKEFTRASHTSEFASQTSYIPSVIKGEYYNDVLGSAVDDSNSVKLYDTVPFEAKSLEVARNRLFLGNIKEGLENPRKMKAADMSVDIETVSFNSTQFNQEIRDRGGIVGFSCSSAYQVGLAFFDFAGRTGGVLTDDSVKVITNERNLVYTTYNAFINYDLTSPSAKTLIPDWATHYSILRTKNLTKDFTIGNLADKIRYYQFDSTSNFTVRIEKVDADGDPTGKFSDNEFTSFDAKHEGIAIGLGDLTSYKQGYSYQEGDRIKLITDSKVMEFSITGTMGRYVLVNLVNVNGADYLGQTSLANSDYSVVYEIYSPHKIQPNEFYYESERGQIYNPGQASRSYSNPTGRLIGDVYMKAREADTSTVPPHFVEGSARSDNAHSDPFKGNAKYIGFPYFHGEGLNDMTANTGLGVYTGGNDRRFEIKITSTSGSADQFQWRSRTSSQRMTNTAFSNTTTITGSDQTLAYGVKIQFAATTGHTVGEKWSVHGKTVGDGLGNVNSSTYSMITSPPNGGISAGSEVKLHQKEHQNKTFGDENREWTVTMAPSEITKNFATIEEFYWESSFGSKICAVHPDHKIFFRRSTIDLSGDNGKNRMYILDSEANSNTATDVSQSDGTLVHMIIKSDLTQNWDGEAKVDTNHDFRVDLPDEYFYSAESMNPSDDYFLNWIQTTGRPNLIPGDVSSQNKTTGIVFSETKIPGSKVNGLSKFSALDEDRLDDATGPLRKLAITSKTQSTGTVMLAISENETTSIYLGEQQLQQASSGSQFLSVSKGVIGTKNSLQGSFGTTHPESVAVNEGKAYWYDAKNATVIKYDTNGLSAIGDVKMKSYFKEKSDIISSDTLKPFIPGTYDAYNNEYLITMPQTGESVTVIQGGSGDYGGKPVITVVNTPATGGGKLTGDLTVLLDEPWNQTHIVGFIDGNGVLPFASSDAFTIPSNVVKLPTGEHGITVSNDASNGFTFTDGKYLPGVGSLNISEVKEGVNGITLQLQRETVKEPKLDILVNNPLTYLNHIRDGKASSSLERSQFTPIRLVTPSYTGVTEEQKTIESTDGNLVIPFTSNNQFKLGSTTPSTGFTYTENNLPINIPIANISTNATQVGSDASLHYYSPGSWNLTITGITSNMTRVDIDSRIIEASQVITLPSSNILTSGFTANGELVASGEGTVTEKGFVYSSSNTSPVVGGVGTTQCVVSGSELGNFFKVIASLSADTAYYHKAYVKTEVGVVYGNCLTTRTGSASNSLPTIETSDYNADLYDMVATITANGGAEITIKGFVLGKNDTPVIGQAEIIQKSITTDILGFPHVINYELDARGMTLTPSTKYFYRGYATNNVGTAYGKIVNFTTPAAVTGQISLVEMITNSTLSADGGKVYFRLTKRFDSTGVVSGDISISDTISGSESIGFSIPASETNQLISYNIPANTGDQRSIGFTIDKFTPTTTNGTGDNVPILIKRVVTQSGGGRSGSGNELEEKY